MAFCSLQLLRREEKRRKCGIENHRPKKIHGSSTKKAMKKRKWNSALFEEALTRKYSYRKYENTKKYKFYGEEALTTEELQYLKKMSESYWKAESWLLFYVAEKIWKLWKNQPEMAEANLSTRLKSEEKRPLQPYYCLATQWLWEMTSWLKSVAERNRLKLVKYRRSREAPFVLAVCWLPVKIQKALTTWLRTSYSGWLSA